MKKLDKDTRGFIKFAICTVGLLLIMLLIIFLKWDPKKPATAEQVWDVMVEHGYQPYDVTSQNESLDPKREKCIAFKKDDMQFEFYVFTSKSRAIDAYGWFYTEIILNKNHIAKVEHETKLANFAVYTLKVSGTYNVAIYVENTAVYAYCDEINMGEIGDILKEIGYFN